MKSSCVALQSPVVEVRARLTVRLHIHRVGAGMEQKVRLFQEIFDLDGDGVVTLIPA